MKDRKLSAVMRSQRAALSLGTCRSGSDSCRDRTLRIGEACWVPCAKARVLGLGWQGVRGAAVFVEI